MRVDGSDVTPVWQANSREQAFSPSWSPQGDRIAFVRYRPQEGLRLALIRPDGSGLSILDDGGPALGEVLDPAWSPDGRYLFFAADPTGIFDIFAYDIEMGALYQVTNVLTGAYEPAISPDGKTLAYTGYSAAGYDQYVMPIDKATWRPYAPESVPPAAPDEGGPAAPAAPEHFRAQASPPVSAPASKYSPWPTLSPAVGYAMIGGDTTGQYYIQLAIAGMDVLETTSYVFAVDSSGLGTGYEMQLDLRLRPFVLSLYSDLNYEEDYLTGHDWRNQSVQMLLRGGTGGLLAPDDQLDWSLLAYHEAYADLDNAFPPETYRGGELSLAYGRTSLYRGPVDVASGFHLGFDLGAEELLETGEIMVWRDIWGRLYVPMGTSRLELAASLDQNTAGKAEVDLGKGYVPGPEGDLIWEAEASLEFPLIQAEAASLLFYLHAVNGLLAVYGGQSLDPLNSMAYSYGLGVNFRLQMGYSLPFDLSMM